MFNSDNKKSIIFCQWNAFMQQGIQNALDRMNINYDIFYRIPTNWDNDSSYTESFRNYLKGKISGESSDNDDGEINDINRYYCVFSVNFMPLISDVCQEFGIKYISWIYDAPIHIRRTDTLKNSVNEIYAFDRVQAEKYASMGIKAHHLVLAADTDVFSRDGIRKIIEQRKKLKNPWDAGFVPTGDESGKYICDVALVGKLYTSEYNVIANVQDQYTKGVMEGIIGSQLKIYGGYFLGDVIDDRVMNLINGGIARVTNGRESVIKEQVEYALATEITRRERFMALSLLQNRCKVLLCSNESDSSLNNVNNIGYVDYYTQMPEVFRQAKINLNISLKIIQSGIPLRVMDVLGCGGFLITNYQPELEEYFVNGEDLVIYEDMTDLVLKVQYYLEHDDERRRIADNGFKKVKELCSFDDRIKKMFML